MPDRGDITQWLNALKDGNQDAAGQLWSAYFHKLTRLVERKLPGPAKRAFDEEDVALSAFKSFCLGMAEERFPELSDRGNLWAILVVIATRKAQAYVDTQRRQKRGGGQVRGDSVFLGLPLSKDAVGFDAIAGNDPTPEFIAQAEEECQRLLDSLKDDALRQLAILKMQGFSIEEIAAQLGCTKRAVRRRLDIVRGTWRQETSEDRGGT